MNNFFNFINHLIFPNCCIFCNNVINFNKLCCNKCSKVIPFNKENKCNKCSKYKCICYNKNIYFDKVIAPFEYISGPSNAIKKFKFNGYKSYSKSISKYMIDEISKNPDIINSDMIIPIPMTKKDKRKRGFNQSEILAKHISKHFNIKLETKLIVKTKQTLNQHNLSETQRSINLINAYSCTNHNLIENKSIILCDDVYTTGTTLNVISHLLKNIMLKKLTV